MVKLYFRWCKMVYFSGHKIPYLVLINFVYAREKTGLIDGAKLINKTR